MIALDTYYGTADGALVFCSFCGGTSYCGTGHHEPYYARRQVLYYAPPPLVPHVPEHHFRASALGRRYIPVPLALSAAPLVEVEKPWKRPESFARPVRARRAARARAVAPLRSRPGRRRRIRRTS